MCSLGEVGRGLVPILGQLDDSKLYGGRRWCTCGAEVNRTVGLYPPGYRPEGDLRPSSTEQVIQAYTGGLASGSPDEGRG